MIKTLKLTIIAMSVFVITAVLTTVIVATNNVSYEKRCYDAGGVFIFLERDRERICAKIERIDIK